MAYERINWQNEPSEATALNDVNLNKMDSAIYELDGKATATDTAITNLQNGKVDKVNGKGLSQVDNVTVTQHVAYGTVVSTIKTYGQDGTEVTSQVCNGIVVDSALSNSSTNPVQNKVVKSAIDEKSTVAISDTLETGTTLANITIDGTTTAIKGSDIEVDEELSPTSENPVENKAIYDALNNLLPSKTVSGNPIAISDASGFNAKALKVTMNHIQSGSGDPSPTNIRPISGRTEASVTRTGVNVWGGETLADDIVSKVPNATKDTTEKVVAYTASNISSISNLFTKFKPNTRYTAIIRMKGGVPNMSFKYTDGTRTGISVGVTVSTEGKTVQCIAGEWQTGSSSMYYDQSGIFEGVKTADDFEPYTAETHTHQYSETIYGGVDDFVNGGATSTMGMVDMGTLTWSLGTNGVFNATVSTLKTPTNNILCSQYKTISYSTPSALMNDGEIKSYGISSAKYIYVKDSTYSDAETFKVAMSGVQLCYELDTPTTIETSAENITLLKGNNVLSTNADDMELKYSVSLDSLLPTTTRTLAKSPIVEEPKEETDETEEQR